MNFVFDKESITSGKKLCEVMAEERIENEFTLPDYCKDIKKVLRCSLVPGVHTVSLSGERVSSKGTATVRIIYLAEGDKVDVFEKSLDISSTTQIKDIPEGAVIVAKASVDFVNCRAVSQRKFTVSGGVSTAFSCFAGKKAEFIKPCDDGGLQMKTEKSECENLLGFFEKCFDMGETVALNSEHPPVGKIISCITRCENQSHKLSSGKLLIKADVITTVRYIPENSENSFHCFNHSMPLSQIVDVRELPDGAVCDISLTANQVLCNFKADSSGSNKLVELSLRIGAFIKASEKKQCEMITDCYCTEGELEATYLTPDILLNVREIDEVNQARGVAELPSSFREICFADCISLTKNIKYSRDKADFDCSALIFIMYIDENGVPCCCEKNLDFDFSYSIVKKCNEPFGMFDIEPVALSFNPEGSDKADFVLDYRVCGKIYDVPDRKILTEVTLSENGEAKNDAVALTLYYCDSGERLWDIAKSHNTTVALIKEENGIKGDTVEEKMMLLIPCV